MNSLPEPSSPSSTRRVPFPDTAWTRILTGTGDHPEDASRALEELCRQYRPAIYSYLRALGLPNEEAEDTTQEFIAGFILGEPLHRAAPERGRLRAYMKQSIRHFLAKQRRSAACQKRGGTMTGLHFDEHDHSLPTIAPEPDQTYDREWAWAVMERAVTTLRDAYTARGRGTLFGVIRPLLAGADDTTTYSMLAVSAGVSEALIKLEVHRARKRLAETLRREVAATVASESEVDSECRYLLQVLAHE